jgi:hypothetical protein
MKIFTHVNFLEETINCKLQIWHGLKFMWAPQNHCAHTLIRLCRAVVIVVDFLFFFCYGLCSFLYKEWSTPHAEAEESFPIIFDRLKLDADAKHDEL